MIDDHDQVFLWLSVLSVIGSSILIFSIRRMEKDQYDALYQNVLWMSLCDLCLDLMFVGAFSYHWGTSNAELKDDPWCHFSFIVDSFFSAATVLWYLMVAINTFLTVRGCTRDYLHRINKYQHMVAWGYPAIITIVGLALQGYATMPQFYCWYPTDTDPSRWTFYGVISVSILFCIFLLIYTAWCYYAGWFVFKDRTVQGRVVLLRLAFMVVFYVSLWGMALSARINEWIRHDHNSLHLVSLTASGLVNFLIWGVTSPKMWEIWKQCMPVCARCRCNKQSSDDVVLDPRAPKSDHGHRFSTDSPPHDIEVDLDETDQHE